MIEGEKQNTQTEKTSTKGKWKYKYYDDPDSPYADAQGRVFYHREAAAKKLGRLLDPREVVHHIDADRTNNDPDNLMVFASQSDHMRFHQGIEAVLEGDHYITYPAISGILSLVYQKKLTMDEAVIEAKKYHPDKINICPICGKETLNKFCSSTCQSQWQRAQIGFIFSEEELIAFLSSKESVFSFSKRHGCSDKTITKALRQKDLPFTKEEILQYRIERGIILPKIIKPKQEPSLPKPVYQIDKDTNEIINTFASIRQASMLTKIESSHISKVCHGERKTAGNYIWKFCNEEDKDKK